MKPEEKVFEKYLEDNKHINLLSPDMNKKTDKELKKDLFDKMLLPYIIIALQEQAIQIFDDINKSGKEEFTDEDDYQVRYWHLDEDDFDKLKNKWVKE